MTLNDKLKGEYYRTPITKLASRTNINNKIEELNHYFDSLTELIDKTYDRVSSDRIEIKEKIGAIAIKVAHFKYLLDHFNVEIDQHIVERLQLLITNFTSNIVTFVEPYELNLFNHLGQTDKDATISTNKETLDEWDRSINCLPTDLGIRWYGGKLNDKNIFNNLRDILHIVKVNTTSGYNNEDYINSNLILELFLYGPKGMYWIVLGQNATFDYNYIIKYQSQKLNMDLKLASENYKTPKSYEINKFDLNLIINTLFEQNDIVNGNVYIKIKTNIPSNSESGRDGYYLSGSKKFDSYSESESVVNTANKLLYHDNKDIAYLKKDKETISDIFDARESFKDIKPDLLINPITKQTVDTSINNEFNIFYSHIKTIPNNNKTVSISKEVFNPNNDKMKNLSDNIDGITITNSNIDEISTDDKYFNKSYNNTNTFCDKTTPYPEYESGKQIVDLFDYHNIGTPTHMGKNENMFEVDNDFNTSTRVIVNDSSNISTDKSIYNYLSNNRILDILSGKEKGLININQIKTYNYLDDPYVKTFKTPIGTIIFTNNNGVKLFDPVKNVLMDTTITNSVKALDCITDPSTNYVYVGTDNGIYRYDSASTKSNELVASFVKTNIVNGVFDNFCICGNKRAGSLIAYSRSGSVMSTDDGRYELNNVIFVCRGNSWYEIKDILKTYLTAPEYADCYKLNNQTLAESIFSKDPLSTNKEKFKVFFNKFENKYYIFNNEKGVLLISEGLFPNTYSKYELDNILDVEYNSKQNVLYLIQKFEDGNKVFKISNGVRSELNYKETMIKNNRKQFIYNYKYSNYKFIKKEDETPITGGNKIIILTDGTVIISDNLVDNYNEANFLVEANDCIYNNKYKFDKKFDKLNKYNYYKNTIGTFNDGSKLVSISSNKANEYIVTIDAENIKKNISIVDIDAKMHTHSHNLVKAKLGDSIILPQFEIDGKKIDDAEFEIVSYIDDKMILLSKNILFTESIAKILTYNGEEKFLLGAGECDVFKNAEKSLDDAVFSVTDKHLQPYTRKYGIYQTMERHEKLFIPTISDAHFWLGYKPEELQKFYKNRPTGWWLQNGEYRSSNDIRFDVVSFDGRDIISTNSLWDNSCGVVFGFCIDPFDLKIPTLKPETINTKTIVNIKTK